MLTSNVMHLQLSLSQVCIEITTLYLLCDLANCLSLFLSLTLAMIKPIKAAVLATSSNVVIPKRDPKIIVSFDISPLSPISPEVHLDSRLASDSNHYQYITWKIKLCFHIYLC